MSTNDYTAYTARMQYREEGEQANPPQECPHCHRAINQSLARSDKPRQHCGSGKCRQAVSRATRTERKRQERTTARERILHYCDRHLDRDQWRAVMNMCDQMMHANYDNGHQVAEAVINVMRSRQYH